jgi:NTP pyrophosphatase (non-canonical NTP hydrolase)
MFRDVYGVPSSFLGQAGTAAPGTRLQLVAGSNRLHEELSELAEAMRLEHVFPIAVTSELADVFGWMMAVANVLPTRMACR